MTDNNFVAEIEEGVVEGSDPTETASPTPLRKMENRLSVVSRQYDIDGDGVLDPAELAMRNLDRSGRGYLTNDKVYALMQEQLALQKSMFQMKKIIWGLLAFVVLLALANLGTSFASAILAKDTTTANGELVDVKTNEAVATGQAVTVFTVGADDGDNARKLCTVDNDKSTKNICDVNAGAGFTTISNGNALAMLKDCMAGAKPVQLRHVTGSQVNTKMVCSSGICGGSTFELTNNEPTSGLLCTADSDQKLLVKPSSTTAYSLLTVSAACFTDAECGDSRLFCQVFQIAYGMMAAESCGADRDCTNYGGVCDRGICGSCNATFGCDPNSDSPVCISTGETPNRCGCSSNSCKGVGETCAVPSCISGGNPICHVDGRYPSCQGTCEFKQQV